MYVVIAILIGVVIYMHQNQDTEDTDPRILEYENIIDQMKQDAEKESKRVDSLIQKRDSTIIKLEAKEAADKEVIHEKFNKKRDDILVLSDDESVQLLTKNIKGIRFPR